MIKRLTISITLFCLTVLALPAPAGAFNFFSACNSDTASTAACHDNTGNNPISGKGGLILSIANIVAYIAGGAAVILLVVSALRYITAGGNPEKAAVARSTAINALIGIAVIVLAKTLIDFVISKL